MPVFSIIIAEGRVSATMIQKPLNKNEQLFQDLYHSIRNGEIPNGARLATELELADQYGCSRITVRTSLRQLEELKLIRRVRGNGTYVNTEGVRFSSRRNIAVIASEVHSGASEVDPYFSQLMMGLFQHGNTLDFSANFIVQRAEEHSFLESFERQSINISDYDGLVFAKQLSGEEIAVLEGQRRKFVALQSPAGDEEISYITIDNFNGAYMATRHLLERGRRDIVFLHGSLDERINREKVDGFFFALNEFGCSSALRRRHYEMVPHLEESGAAVIRRLLEEDQKFDALLIHGDWATFGAVNVLRERNVRIPKDVALVMYDDYAGVQRMLKLAITAVRQPFTEQIRCALQILLRQLDRPGATRTIQLIQPMLMIRETT